jgi:hypothetical protein
MISIDEMEKMLDEVASEFPKEFFERLNGGIILLPQAKPHPGSRRNDLFIMGEYYGKGNLGSYIAIYYGSFMRIYGRLLGPQLKAQLRKTLRHEFRHHLETLAGERGLEIEDEEYLARYLRRYGRSPGK